MILIMTLSVIFMLIYLPGLFIESRMVTGISGKSKRNPRFPYSTEALKKCT